MRNADRGTGSREAGVTDQSVAGGEQNGECLTGGSLGRVIRRNRKHAKSELEIGMSQGFLAVRSARP
jgi:hypothetical protein